MSTKIAGGRMFAITFDMDTEILAELYHQASYNNAYGDIARFLGQYGFTRQQGSVYFGNDRVDAVTCVIATQGLTREYPWFGPSVRDIRMLRIEDNNNLKPAIDLEMTRTGNMPPPKQVNQSNLF
ncbi:MAG: virulence factor [Alphaproteobacteria bacterium]|nr:virulence factor [Alphaproteobacteria bacterium]